MCNLREKAFFAFLTDELKPSPCCFVAQAKQEFIDKVSYLLKFK